MVVVLRLPGAAAASWAADHNLAAAVVDTAIARSEAPIASCTAPDTEEFAVMTTSPNSTAHID